MDLKNYKGGRIDYEDTLVAVFDADTGIEVYKGAEDDNPGKDMEWAYNSDKGYYTSSTVSSNYIKIKIL